MPYYSKDPLWRKRTVWIRHVEVMLCLKHFNLMVILSSGSDGGFAMHFMFNFLPWLSLLQNCQLAENDFLMTFSIPFLAYSKNCSSERFFRQQHIPTADQIFRVQAGSLRKACVWALPKLLKEEEDRVITWLIQSHSTKPDSARKIEVTRF